MNEEGDGAFPQIFVVDSQASYSNLPSVSHLRTGRIRQRLLPVLVGMALFGVLVEACFIAYLCSRIENPAHEASQQNMGSTQQHTAPGGSSNREKEGDMVHWESHLGEVVVHEMEYADGRLVIKKGGDYFIYSKVHFAERAADKCSLLLHKFIKRAYGYENPIELMKAKRYHCSSQHSADNDGLYNSYLGGVFHLFAGDAIYITVNKKELLRLGSADNFMGAFMI
ncbi:tumor necrosis factor ligand superfamily member 14-like [Aplochiton taeniatus]